MRIVRVSATSAYYLLLIISLLAGPAIAQNKTSSDSKKSVDNFDLKDGDRVVFLGNSVFENDFEFGYLELALTTKFADKFVTFRNLGWTGDNVFGDARSTFTNPPTAYQHLIQNIIKTQPSVVFLAYGGVEAQEGQAGLSHFKDGLNNLLNKIDSLGARTILLSPLPVISADSAIGADKRNADIQLYSSEIEKIASQRGKKFIDLYNPVLQVSKKSVITENGIHLNEAGYYYLAEILENNLGLKSDPQPAAINVSKQSIETSENIKKMKETNDLNNLKFTINQKYLPLPAPKSGELVNSTPQIFKISGLKKGFYTLKEDGFDLITASAKDWETGIEIKNGAAFNQANLVKNMILKKNDLFFFQYRPINETYIIGFRAYEQGKHVKDLDDQSILIKFLESQIAMERMPKPHIYQISALK
ncbi:GDSL-type esterase/lipase family protein [Dyadobacter sp. CY345]|uniref:GDSL-type esterase/lipase family protein n=1 Tax=Dyadobacter sp. CY345 TaxID=2909335 RepID=UPI001F23421C|nr:GDSL-type esterase/lipase family protein [Dyadobacter sp. CY345]MCF2447705.1 GDSL-type esterase/lipase family protein [Dyadobacter sp. CY345]